ncbi:MAG: hypothetical protein JWN56_805 [Sphingobacteriales bacterium]|nr:hypothetical protein [Sphingobacteriales bacterium]
MISTAFLYFKTNDLMKVRLSFLFNDLEDLGVRAGFSLQSFYPEERRAKRIFTTIPNANPAK